MKLNLCAFCWSCEKEYDISRLSPETNGVLCKCGGTIISNSGKIMGRFRGRKKSPFDLILTDSPQNDQE